MLFHIQDPFAGDGVGGFVAFGHETVELDVVNEFKLEVHNQ